MINSISDIKESIFYPLIVSYVYSVHGLLELTSQGFYLELSSKNLNKVELEKFLGTTHIKEPIRKKVIDNPGLTQIVGIQKFYSKIQNNFIDIDINELAKQLFWNHKDHIDHIYQGAKALIISAYESSKIHKDTGELWEFFRHIRNASAHGGKFNFLGDEPRNHAQWRTIEIKPSMSQKRLFKSDEHNEEGILQPGDIIVFLMDLVKKYPVLEQCSF